MIMKKTPLSSTRPPKIPQKKLKNQQEPQAETYDFETEKDDEPKHTPTKQIQPNDGRKILYGLDDMNYDFESLLDLMHELKDSSKLYSGAYYFEGEFENDKASDYTPLEMRDLLEDEFRNVFDGELEPEYRTIYYRDYEKKSEFLDSLKLLIDKYFFCDNKSFTSKVKKRITLEDIKKIEGEIGKEKG